MLTNEDDQAQQGHHGLYSNPHSKVRQACETCRLKKTRCDKKRPRCGYCFTRQLQCRYFTDDDPDHQNYNEPDVDHRYLRGPMMQNNMQFASNPINAQVIGLLQQQVSNRGLIQSQGGAPPKQIQIQILQFSPKMMIIFSDLLNPLPLRDLALSGKTDIHLHEWLRVAQHSSAGISFFLEGLANEGYAHAQKVSQALASANLHVNCSNLFCFYFLCALLFDLAGDWHMRNALLASASSLADSSPDHTAATLVSKLGFLFFESCHIAAAGLEQQGRRNAIVFEPAELELFSPRPELRLFLEALSSCHNLGLMRATVINNQNKDEVLIVYSNLLTAGEQMKMHGPALSLCSVVCGLRLICLEVCFLAKVKEGVERCQDLIDLIAAPENTPILQNSSVWCMLDVLGYILFLEGDKDRYEKLSRARSQVSQIWMCARPTSSFPVWLPFGQMKWFDNSNPLFANYFRLKVMLGFVLREHYQQDLVHFWSMVHGFNM